MQSFAASFVRSSPHRVTLYRSRSRNVHRTILALTVFAVSGCGGYSLPPATSRTVARNDLIGEWCYRPYAPGNPKVVLMLKPDSAFTQTVRVDDQTIAQSGTWALQGADLVLSGVLPEFNGSHAARQAWRIIDRRSAAKGFAILGGSDDPDQWVVFEINHECSAAVEERAQPAGHRSAVPVDCDVPCGVWDGCRLGDHLTAEPPDVTVSR